MNASSIEGSGFRGVATCSLSWSGEPAAIGIRDVNKPDFGDAVTIKPGEVPVFWACGVTPQAVAMAVKPELMITHSPGYMFIGDLRDEELAVL